MQEEFKNAFIARYGSDHYLVPQLDRIYSDNQVKLSGYEMTKDKR